ncbi:MAG: hypothetical protein FWH38_02105 [Treponema sp.]|nr:hypothetical protein [Treponema sp.]
MANKNFLVGMLVMMLVFGMTVVGCGDDSTNNDDDSLQTVSVPIELEGTWYSPSTYPNYYQFNGDQMRFYTNTSVGWWPVYGVSEINNTDSATRLQFPSGYKITHMILYSNGETAIITSDFCLNAAKTQIVRPNYGGGIWTKQP